MHYKKSNLNNIFDFLVSEKEEKPESPKNILKENKKKWADIADDEIEKQIEREKKEKEKKESKLTKGKM